MPDNPLASLYPQPPQISGGNALSGDPARVIGMVNALNQNALFQKEFAAKQAVGAAYQGAVDPSTGLVDTGAAGRAISSDPNAAFGAPEAYGSLAQLHGQQTANDTAAFKLAVGQSSTLQDAVGAMANDPALTPDKVISTVTGIARRTNVPSPILNSVLESMPQGGNPKALQNWARNFGVVSMGSALASDRTSGPPDPNTGAPNNISRGQATYAGSYPSALPPGQEGALAAGQNAFIADQQKATQTMAGLRPLEQALPLLKELSVHNYGPGSPEFAKIKGALAQLGWVGASDSDLDVSQEVGKKLIQYARGAPGAERSDQSLSTALGSNPSLVLSKPANLNLVQNQIAMDRMDAAMPTAFQMEQGTGMNARAAYPGYRAGYYPRMDPRAFQFDMMSPQERTNLLTNLGVKFDAQGRPTMPAKPSPALQKFQQSYAIARQAANYAGQNNNGQ